MANRLQKLLISVSTGLSMTGLAGLGLPAGVQAVTPARPKLTREMLNQFSYHTILTGDVNARVRLVKGQLKFAEGFIELEKIAWGDLNGDGYEDAAVQLAESGGGSGNFRGLQIVLNQRGKPVLAAPNQSLGDRIIVKRFVVQHGVIVLDMIVQDENDGACCPTMPITVRYKLVGQKLVEVKK
ncbi:MAG: hypothetical protein ACAI44_17125 [Candidatus Sericytochromatia bacterium]